MTLLSLSLDLAAGGATVAISIFLVLLLAALVIGLVQ